MAQQIPIIIARVDYREEDGGGHCAILAFSPYMFFKDDNYGIQLQEFIENMNQWIIAKDFVLNEPDYHIRNSFLPLADRNGSCWFSQYKDSLDVVNDSPIFFDWRQADAYAATEPNLISCDVLHNFV